MKKTRNIQDINKQTEKQHLILKLRLAMETNRVDIIETLAKEITNLLKIKNYSNDKRKNER